MTISAAEHGWVATDDRFGARLALIRQRMGWGNVKEAALACGVPVESWRNWERDGRLPRDLVTIASRISGATGCDVGWLAGLPMSGLPRMDSNHQPAVETYAQVIDLSRHRRTADRRAATRRATTRPFAPIISAYGT
jgi:transcriptional regulator with XRE-family HTH domain